MTLHFQPRNQGYTDAQTFVYLNQLFQQFCEHCF